MQGHFGFLVVFRSMGKQTKCTNICPSIERCSKVTCFIYINICSAQRPAIENKFKLILSRQNSEVQGIYILLLVKLIYNTVVCLKIICNSCY